MNVEAQFVGRSGELRVLGDALGRAREGSAAFVLIEGPGGIGKTALVRHFLHDVDGVTVLWASGDEAETDLEFGVLDQLQAAFPIEGAMTRGDGAGGAGALAVGVELLAGLGTLESDMPVVMVLDDLHLADRASSQALLFALRRLGRDQILVVATTRPHELDGLGAGWPRMFGGELASVIRLGGLDDGQVGDLATGYGRELPVQAARSLREHTDGNPLYVQALLDELPLETLLGATAVLPAPRSYAATVSSRLDRLPAPARVMVNAAAVFGTTRVPMSAVTAICAAEHAVDDPTAAVRVAEAAGLIRTIAGPDEVIEFTHPLVRAAVYGELSSEARRELHRVASTIVDLPAALRHLVAAAEGPDIDLAVRLRAHGETELARGALPAAARFFELASQVEPDQDTVDLLIYQTFQLLSGYADFHGMQALVERIRTRPASAYRRLVLAVFDAADGRLAQAVVDLRDLADSISPQEEPDLFSRVATALGSFSALLDDHTQAVHWAQRACRTPGVEPFIESTARQGLVYSYAMTGRFTDALALLADCSPRHSRPAAFEPDLLALRGLVHTWAGDHQSAISELRAVDHWVRLGSPCVSTPRAYAALAEAELRTGAWDDASNHAEVAISLAEAFDLAWYLPYAHQVAAGVAALRGDADLAATHAVAARQSTGSGAVGEGMGYAALAEAHRAWAVADWPAVSTALRPLAEAPEAVREHPNLVAWRYRLAEARIGEGRPREALALLEQAPAEDWGGIEAADRTRLRALALQRLGETAAARATFTDGLTALRGEPTSYAGALLCVDWGRFLAGVNEADAAESPIRSAREVFRRLGATARRDECDAVLATVGTRVADAVLDALTPRERMVARLVADGATNREVAAQLYLSVKGVEYHLGNIFTKLSLASRRQLRPLVEADLAFKVRDD